MAWIEDLQRLKMTLVFCPECQIPLQYLKKGEGVYRCEKCHQLIRAAVDFLDQHNNKSKS